MLLRNRGANGPSDQIAQRDARVIVVLVLSDEAREPATEVRDEVLVVVIDLNVDVESVLIVDSNVVIGQRAQGDNDSTTEETVRPVSEDLATPMVQRMKGTRVPSSTATTVGQGLVDVPMTVSTDVLRVVAAASATVRHRTTGVMVPGVEGNLETDSSRLRGLT